MLRNWEWLDIWWHLQNGGFVDCSVRLSPLTFQYQLLRAWVSFWLVLAPSRFRCVDWCTSWIDPGVRLLAFIFLFLRSRFLQYMLTADNIWLQQFSNPSIFLYKLTDFKFNQPISILQVLHFKFKSFHEVQHFDILIVLPTIHTLLLQSHFVNLCSFPHKINLLFIHV